MGECHMALGHFHQALDDLERCIARYPAHPETYRARLLASQASVQLKKLDNAKKLLVDNLHNSELTPRSLQWQRSLFAYGHLLYKEALAREAESRTRGVDSPDPATRQQGLDYLYAAHVLFMEAIKHLEEAVQRYPSGEQTNEAWYAIGQCYRRAARLPALSLSLESLPADRQRLEDQRRTYLTMAADAYRQLQVRLSKQQEEQQQLSSVEQAMLRNAHFAYADALFDLEDYEQAIKAYLAATHRYPQEPASLEAFVQLANCYRRLNAPAEARGTLLQAQAALARMKSETDFTRTTRYNRQEWEEIIGWLAQM
jgi:TolA-binding protein